MVFVFQTNLVGDRHPAFFPARVQPAMQALLGIFEAHMGRIFRSTSISP
jgi:hypothetical protein